jgi:hypothetical protein
MAGSGIIVSYGSSVLQPTPIVNYSRNPINLGGYIYGYNTDVSLDGWSTGIVSTGVTISSLTGIFANQFQPLVVTDSTGAVLYNWPNITVKILILVVRWLNIVLH